MFAETKKNEQKNGMVFNMTGEQTVQVITALVPALLAFLSLIGIVVTAVLAYKTSKKSDEIITKANVIEHSTNSNLSRLTSELELMRTEFKGLKDSSAKEVQALEATIARQIGDKKTAEDVAAKLADKTPQAAAPEAKTADAKLKLKDEVVIEGTLETKN